jgi:hypothetical protein
MAETAAAAADWNVVVTIPEATDRRRRRDLPVAPRGPSALPVPRGRVIPDKSCNQRFVNYL